MKKIILFVLALLLGLMFVNAGMDKFFHYMPMPEQMPEETTKDFQALMEIAWLMPLIAVAEIVGGLLVIIPRTRALGALVLLPIIVGILLMNLVVDSSGLALTLPMTGILGWIMYDNRKKYAPMF